MMAQNNRVGVGVRDTVEGLGGEERRKNRGLLAVSVMIGTPLSSEAAFFLSNCFSIAQQSSSSFMPRVSDGISDGPCHRCLWTHRKYRQVAAAGTTVFFQGLTSWI